MPSSRVIAVSFSGFLVSGRNLSLSPKVDRRFRPEARYHFSELWLPLRLPIFPQTSARNPTRSPHHSISNTDPSPINSTRQPRHTRRIRLRYHDELHATSGPSIPTAQWRAQTVMDPWQCLAGASTAKSIEQTCATWALLARAVRQTTRVGRGNAQSVHTAADKGRYLTRALQVLPARRMSGWEGVSVLALR